MRSSAPISASSGRHSQCVSLADQADLLQHARAGQLALFRRRPRWPIRPERATAPSTIPAPLVAGTASLPHGINGTLRLQLLMARNGLHQQADHELRGIVSARARFALTYRYSDRNIGQGVPHHGSHPNATRSRGWNRSPSTRSTGIFNAALHPAKNWDLNGSVEVGYSDNAFTTVRPRQFKQYRVHTIYRPKSWATVSGSYSDRERHNNTNNNQDAAGATNQLQRPRQPRRYSPHRHCGDVIGAKRALQLRRQLLLQRGVRGNQHLLHQRRCERTATAPAVPGVATVTARGAPNLCRGSATRPGTRRDFMDAPTQFASAVSLLNPDREGSHRTSATPSATSTAAASSTTPAT